MRSLENIERVVAEGADYARKVGQRQIWQAYVGSGILGWTMPAACGGRELDLPSLVALFEGLAWGGGDAGILFAIAAQILAVQYPILKFGSEEQKKSLLPRLVSGEIRAAHAATEPESGSDVFNVQTIATPHEGGYRLNGSKCYITSAPVADVALVLASTDPERKGWGLSAFLVDMNSDGVWRSSNIPKMGLQSAEFGEIRFQDCFVPVDRRLGSEGSGKAVFHYAIDLERSFIAAPVLGSMRGQLERAVAEANHRRRRGRSIGNFQSISNRIADMTVRLELARLAIYHAAELKEYGRSKKLFAPVVKLAVSEFFLASSLDLVRIAGAGGYLLNDPAEVNLRDAVGGLFYSGTSDILRNIIAHYAGVSDA
jgi:alkylation response protein AidB-like acyl-CoA dehydrogenase